MDEQLAASHGFTLGHLLENRAGRAHAEQIAAGVRRGRVDVRFGGVAGAVGAVLFLVGIGTSVFPNAIKQGDFHVEWPHSAAPVVAGLFFGVLLSALPLLFGVSAFRSGRRTITTAQAGKVGVASGPLQVLKTRLRGRSGFSHHYLVGGLRLAVPASALSTLDLVAGRQCRVYHSPDDLRILSLEVMA